MKRISRFIAVVLLGVGVVGRAQDAAVTERLNKLSDEVQHLQEASDIQRKQIESLTKELDRLREQQGKPNTSYASQDDLKRLTEAVNDIEKKRQADNTAVTKELERLGNAIGNLGRSGSGSAPLRKNTPKGSPTPPDKTGPGGAPPAKETGYEYQIQPNDTLTSIAKKYNTELGLKLTPDDILKANPGLEERKLMAGKKIWIPAPPDALEASKKTAKSE
jgi:hypothetical protein